jgi:ferritin-like metal-binding protein YciE
MAMSRTASADALLLVCFQDLHAACCAILQRGPGIARQASAPALRAQIGTLLDAAAIRRNKLEIMKGASEGARNLWIAGIVDDAERDTASIAAGALLDTAMIGALRKAVAAERVSHETAIALAGKIGEADYLAALRACHAQLCALDEGLAKLLPEFATRAAA